MPLIYFVSFIFFSRLISLFSFSPLFIDIVGNAGGASSPTFLLSIVCSAYGFTQACFQYPWAVLSDSLPRMKVIRSLLLLFSFASLGCYLSSSIYQLIFFRALQGLCAMQAVVQAYLSDFYKDVQLRRAMLYVGIGVVLALFLGYGTPFAIHFFQLTANSIFLLSFVLSLVAFIASFYIKLPSSSIQEKVVTQKITSLKGLDLYPFAMNFFIHFLHSFLMIMVVMNSNFNHSGQLFPLLLLSLFLAAPALSPSKNIQFILKYSLGLCSINLLAFYFSNSILLSLFLLVNFSLLFILEASIPSMILSYNPNFARGALMGLNSFIQYIAMALGFYCAPYAVQYNVSVYLFLFFSALFFVVMLRLIEMPRFFTNFFANH